MYNYYETMKDDILEYVKENKDYLKEKSMESIYDDMFVEDCITGNASGSYTFSTWKAEENISHNMDLLKEALDEFGGDYGEALERGAEFCDVTIRCYVLGQVFYELEDEIKEILESEEE